MNAKQLEQKFNKIVKKEIEGLSVKELREQLLRSKQLLRAGAFFAASSDAQVFYDEAKCDGFCFVEDVKNLFFFDDEQEEEFFPE